MNLKEKSLILPKFDLVALGGTFDYFHQGHQSFLKEAFFLSKKVLIGLTSNKLVQEKGASEAVLPFNIRKKEMIAFLKKEGFFSKALVLKLTNPFGPTIFDSSIQALIVTNKTKKGGEIINKIRRKKGLSLLKIVKAKIVKSEDNQYLSSTRIRLGEINRQGLCFDRVFRKRLILPKYLRAQLRKPLGKLLTSKIPPQKHTGNERNGLSRCEDGLTITVGDTVTKLFNQEKIRKDLAIVDLKIARQKEFLHIWELGFKLPTLLTVKNPSATITPSLAKAIKKAFQKILKQKGKFVLQVLGEEDLAVLPAILLAPLGSRVFYGQPGQGVVMVKVTETKKNEVLQILKQFGFSSPSS